MKETIKTILESKISNNEKLSLIKDIIDKEFRHRLALEYSTTDGKNMKGIKRKIYPYTPKLKD